MNRIFGLTATAIWLAAMAALVSRDVVPFWTAQEAPRQFVPNGAFQVAIRNSANTRIGTAWLRIVPTSCITTVCSTTFLDVGAIVAPLPAANAVVFDTTLTYQADGSLDQFRVRLDGAPVSIRVVGERCGGDFACTTTIDQMKRTVSLDARLSECLTETLRPFTHLENLHVGQSWRIRTLDLFSILQCKTPELKIQLVTVTGREKIRHRGRQVDCYRVETDGAVAWADDSGLVLRQEVKIPLLGKWTLTDEPYDSAGRSAAIARVREADDVSGNGPNDANPNKRAS